MDWQYASTPIIDDYDLDNPPNVTASYADYAYNQVIELIDKYKPSVLWNDIGWPKKGLDDLPMLFAYYYNHVEDGVVNDRWSDVWHDFTTKEYKLGNMDLENKWENCRGLGLSFAYSAEEDESHILSRRELITLLVETVSHNGNLLINVGPKADGTIPEIQAQRLKEMGAWLKKNGEAIYGTDIWERPLDNLPNNLKSFYTAKDNKVYALIDGLKAEQKSAQIILPNHRETYTKFRSLSLDEKVTSIKQVNNDIVIDINQVPENVDIICFEFTI